MQNTPAELSYIIGIRKMNDILDIPFEVKNIIASYLNNIEDDVQFKDKVVIYTDRSDEYEYEPFAYDNAESSIFNSFSGIDTYFL